MVPTKVIFFTKPLICVHYNISISRFFIVIVIITVNLLVIVIVIFILPRKISQFRNFELFPPLGMS